MKQTYHPPLFHIIGAIVMEIFCNGNGDPVMSFEILQYINTMFSAIISIYIYKCAKELGWLIRCKVLYGMPFNYVYRMSNESSQYIKGVSALSRLGLPSFHQLTYGAIDFHEPAFHSNIWAQTVNTLLYDEGMIKFSTVAGIFAEKLFAVMEAVVFVILVGTMIGMCFMRGVEIAHKLLLAGVFAVVAASYVLFAFQYPFVCTMNGRYLFTGIVTLMLAYGLVKEKIKHTKIKELLFNISDVLIITVNLAVALVYVI